MPKRLTLSPLGHTWLIDLDGTLVKHNGYKLDGRDSLLPGAREFLASIPPCDMIVVITARPPSLKDATEAFLKEEGVRFSSIIYDAPMGERVLINDDKPSGLCTAMAIRTKRDSELKIDITIDVNL